MPSSRKIIIQAESQKVTTRTKLPDLFPFASKQCWSGPSDGFLTRFFSCIDWRNFHKYFYQYKRLSGKVWSPAWRVFFFPLPRLFGFQLIIFTCHKDNERNISFRMKSNVIKVSYLFPPVNVFSIILWLKNRESKFTICKPSFTSSARITVKTTSTADLAMHVLLNMHVASHIHACVHITLTCFIKNGCEENATIFRMFTSTSNGARQ